MVSPVRRARLAGLFLTALLATMVVPTTAAHPAHCDSDGNHSVWAGAYIGQFDPHDPETWQSAIVEQGFACCEPDTQRLLACERWIPTGDPE